MTNVPLLLYCQTVHGAQKNILILLKIFLSHLASLGTHGDAGAAHVRELVAARVAVAGVRGSSAARGTRARGHAHAAHVLVLHAARVAGTCKYYFIVKIFSTKNFKAPTNIFLYNNLC